MIREITIKFIKLKEKILNYKNPNKYYFNALFFLNFLPIIFLYKVSNPILK